MTICAVDAVIAPAPCRRPPAGNQPGHRRPGQVRQAHLSSSPGQQPGGDANRKQATGTPPQEIALGR